VARPSGGLPPCRRCMSSSSHRQPVGMCSRCVVCDCTRSAAACWHASAALLLQEAQVLCEPSGLLRVNGIAVGTAESIYAEGKASAQRWGAGFHHKTHKTCVTDTIIQNTTSITLGFHSRASTGGHCSDSIRSVSGLGPREPQAPRRPPSKTRVTLPVCDICYRYHLLSIRVADDILVV
jgi:hypothetical protein